MLSGLLVAFVLLGAPSDGRTVASKTYTTRCGFSFDYPATWTVAENPAAGIKDPRDRKRLADCGVGLRPPGWTREIRVSPLVLQKYPIRMVFWNATFREAARRSFFVRVSDIEPENRPSAIRGLHPWDWGIYVRQGIAAARQFTTECCQGVQGVSWGIDRAKDGSKATVTWEGAVVNDRKGHSVVLENDDDERFSHIVTRVLPTIRFAPRTP